jgi:hypothetical protein
MLRKVASKVVWLGRTASIVFGLALVLTLIVGVASMALGANGDFFKVGKSNHASAVSTLMKSGAGPALSLKVDRGTPLAVNSSTKVSKLNADQIDGKDSAAFADVNELGGQVVIRSSGPLPVEGTYTSEGGTLVIMASGSGYRGGGIDVSSGRIGMYVKVDGGVRGIADGYAESALVSEVFVGTNSVVEGLPHGTYTIRLEPVYDDDCNTVDETTSTMCTSTNSHDRFAVTVMELSD